MRKAILVLLLIFPLAVVAQGGAATFIEKAVAKLKSDAAVHMDYGYAVYDEGGRLLQEDTGIIRIDGNCYSLLMDNMKVWCDGDTQWSYMRDVNEIYVTLANSEEAQSLSPLNIMERMRSVVSPQMKKNDGKVFLTFTDNPYETGVDDVMLCFDEKSARLERMTINLSGAGRGEVVLSNYAAKCSFSAASYVCPVDKFPGVEVVDMR